LYNLLQITLAKCLQFSNKTALANFELSHYNKFKGFFRFQPFENLTILLTYNNTTGNQYDKKQNNDHTHRGLSGAY
jgi:hypothetical protein